MRRCSHDEEVEYAQNTAEFDDVSGSGAAEVMEPAQVQPAHSEPTQPTAIGRLLYFASQGDVEAVRNVLDDSPKVPVDSQDYDGRTAMHLAASEGHKGVIELLLSRNANVNPVDRWRKTPLADARRYEALHQGSKTDKRQIYQEICNLLVNHGGSTSSPFEIDASELKYTQFIRECNFGHIKLANWRGTNVQARIMERRAELGSPKSDQAKLTKQLSLLQRLRHPNIVQFLGAVQTKTEPLVLVTEYLPMGSLLDLLSKSKNGRLPQKDAMRYALDIARGMNYLQQHKPETVVHCDLNPMNLLRDAGGHLKVAGLHLSEIEWICKYGSDNPDQQLLYSRNLDFARYRAPELLRATGEKTPDTSVDVYSFGVIVREMFEGWSLASRQAHESGASRQIRKEARDAAISRLYPPNLERFLRKCCHPDPANRPSFAKIIWHLEAINKDISNRPFCGLMDILVLTVSAKWQYCAGKLCVRHSQKSRSSVFSVESQKGVKLHHIRSDDQSTCPSIPE